jgi:YD repeat-containing protein
LKNQAANNYQYDEIGNLTQDLEGKNQEIEWTAYGKVSQVTKATGDIISYQYDATGQRISKTFKDKTTFYVRDASGNVMATYITTSPLTPEGGTKVEFPIYGSSRIGVYAPPSGAFAVVCVPPLLFLVCLKKFFFAVVCVLTFRFAKVIYC